MNLYKNLLFSPTFLPRTDFGLAFVATDAIDTAADSGSSQRSDSFGAAAAADLTDVAVCFTGRVFTGLAGNNALLFSNMAIIASLEEGYTIQN